jgi:hypothetical protein
MGIDKFFEFRMRCCEELGGSSLGLLDKSIKK